MTAGDGSYTLSLRPAARTSAPLLTGVDVCTAPARAATTSRSPRATRSPRRLRHLHAQPRRRARVRGRRRRRRRRAGEPASAGGRSSPTTTATASSTPGALHPDGRRRHLQLGDITPGPCARHRASRPARRPAAPAAARSRAASPPAALRRPRLRHLDAGLDLGHRLRGRRRRRPRDGRRGRSRRPDRLRRRQRQRRSRRRRAADTTAGDGSYTLAGLAPGTYAVRVVAAGWACSTPAGCEHALDLTSGQAAPAGLRPATRRRHRPAASTTISTPTAPQAPASQACRPDR